MTTEEIKEYQKEYRAAHKDKIKEYRAAHKDKMKEYQKEYGAAHKEEAKEYMKKYYEDNKAEAKAYHKKYYEDNKTEVLAYTKFYQKQKYCCEDISQIENYSLAKADNFISWDIHHRLETNNSDVSLSRKELKALDMYYNRPASELIFMTRSEHNKLHHKR